MNRIFLAALVAAFIPIAHADTALTLGAAVGYNVFVFSNFTEYNTDAQGRMAIGGNFAPSNGGSFTIAGTQHDVAGVYDLVVGGNMTMSNNSMGGGDIYVGGNMNWTNPSIPHNAYVAGNVTNTGGGSASGTIKYAGTYSGPGYISHQQVPASSITPPIDFLSAKTTLESLSTTLEADTANGTVSHSYSTYTLTGADATKNIFNLTDSSYSGATINITAPAGSTVIINVPGSADSFNGGSINLSGVSVNNVIFNFFAATSLSVGSIAFNGTILAPLASFDGSWGQINGQLIANSAQGTTQLNDALFTGNLGSGGPSTSHETPVTTPEPSTWLLFATGLAIVGLHKFRQRHNLVSGHRFER